MKSLILAISLFLAQFAFASLPAVAPQALKLSLVSFENKTTLATQSVTLPQGPLKVGDTVELEVELGGVRCFYVIEADEQGQFTYFQQGLRFPLEKPDPAHPNRTYDVTNTAGDLVLRVGASNQLLSREHKCIAEYLK